MMLPRFFKVTAKPLFLSARANFSRPLIRPNFNIRFLSGNATHNFQVKKDLNNILTTEGTKHFLRDIMRKISNEKDLIHFIHRYTVFNGNFAGGVANLAGAFHVRQDLFKTPSPDQYQGCDDVSADIASYVYFAAEDEYANRDNKARITHRALGQFFLQSSLRYLRISPTEFNSKISLNPQTETILADVIYGYRINRENTEDDLYAALGFHLGSEILADEEFNIVDQYLRANWEELVEFVAKETNSTGQNGYDWVRYHTFVEVEHFNNAVMAVNLILNNYAGRKNLNDVYDGIINGFLNFAKMQKMFFGNILHDNNKMITLQKDENIYCMRK